MGIFLSFAVAFIDAFNNTFIKKGLAKHSTLVVSLAWTGFSLLVLIPVLFWMGVPVIQKPFWWSTTIKIVLQTLALILYAAALKKADMSQALPMLAFTPLATLVISFFINGDTPSVTGIIGIVAIFVGAFLLSFAKNQKVLIAPLGLIIRNRGVLYMFLVSIIWAITTSLDRVAVRSSSPIFYSTVVAVSITAILLPIVILRHKKEFLSLLKPQSLKMLVRVGIFDGILQLVQMTAVGLTLASYVISIKRSSIIISSVLGHIVFKEEIKKRIIPILIMFFGILLIVLFK